jgi:hypothetical protein
MEGEAQETASAEVVGTRRYSAVHESKGLD